MDYPASTAKISHLGRQTGAYATAVTSMLVASASNVLQELFTIRLLLSVQIFVKVTPSGSLGSVCVTQVSLT
jgi:hypothetical protein